MHNASLLKLGFDDFFRTHIKETNRVPMATICFPSMNYSGGVRGFPAAWSKQAQKGEFEAKNSGKVSRLLPC
jgi:hypothetical protein